MNRRDFNRLLVGSSAIALAGAGLPGTALAQSGGGLAQGVLTSIIQPEPPMLILALNQQTPTGVVAGKIYESLLSYDFELKPQPQLAEKWKISADGLTYTFHLVKTAKWHDGTPFTSADVIFTCTKMLPAVHPRARANFARCASITAPDDYTVVFTLKEAFPPFILAFETSSAPIMPKHLYEGGDYQNSPHNQTPVGTGPFKFVKWQRGSFIHLTAFGDYYKTGEPGLKDIFYRVIPDAASRAAAMQSGDTQLAQWSDIETFQVKSLAAQPNLTMTTKGYEFFSPVMWFELNNRVKPMDDKRFRQAIAHLIDKDFIVKRIMFGLAKAATGPVASTTPYYEPDVPKFDFSVEKAKALLDEMGLKPGPDGTRVSLKFLVAPYGEVWTRGAEYFKQAVAKAGIKITLENTDVGGWGSRVANWDYEITTDMTYQFGDPALGVTRSYVSTNIRKGVLFSNTEGYKNPEVDDLAAKAAIEIDPKKRQELYSKMQKILVEDQPVVWVTENHYPTIYDKRLKDLIVTATGVNGTFAEAKV